MQKLIMLECKFTLLTSVPENWNAEEIDFFYNDGSSCSDNWLDEIVQQAKRMGCSCHFSEFNLLRDATDSDKQDFLAGDSV